jgi:hypothetical protein
VSEGGRGNIDRIDESERHDNFAEKRSFGAGFPSRRCPPLHVGFRRSLRSRAPILPDIRTLRIQDPTFFCKRSHRNPAVEYWILLALNDDDLKGCNVSTDEGRSRLTAMGQENDGRIEIAADHLFRKPYAPLNP